MRVGGTGGADAGGESTLFDVYEPDAVTSDGFSVCFCSGGRLAALRQPKRAASAT